MSKTDTQPPAVIEQVLQTAEQRLTASSDSARFDAELLLEFVSGIARHDFHRHADATLPNVAMERFEKLLARRLAGEPVAYIIGTQGFWTFLVEVTPEVLIPRPETELLVERALQRLSKHDTVRIADLGTGSGAIALALASELPRAQIVATDVSPAALRIAARNAQRLRLGNLSFREGEWFAPLSGEHFDLIVSNPPYISATDEHVADDVRRFEPHLALFAARNGIDAIERIICAAARHLRLGGWLLLEHGWQQAAQVRHLLLQNGFTQVGSHADLAGHERATEGQCASVSS